MSFLEAMGPGMAVIAPDGATMRAWGDEARRQCIQGREAWPGYLRYRIWKLLLAVRKVFFPWIRRRGAKRT